MTVSPSAPHKAAAPRRVLAIASSGGHWQQLMLMRPGFTHHDVTYATTLPGLAQQFDAAPAHLVPDCNRNEPLQALRCLIWLVVRFVRLRPHVVITTGALPGLLALILGKVTGARTIWVDSVANAETLSASGQTARRFADLWLSQWPDVARDSGADYAGSVL
ncbi:MULTISPECIES: UDP-N-acetylglucosamine--LPS N-acetylglucosamine transferase [Rhodobacterales]|uniref:UDP-N-acetylglucosamine--LPS N-acetylglucosamine transferase n=1 Tax=Rhodobacterales TaxID=204455 RepID=UPI00329895EE